ncbi:MAG TPA: hypothetical protein PK264_07155, partial [Hyphomicrobiaceae bacterium]|nr:hypothetical protein [Hyphomicrobiaceae bacterium]
MSVERVSGAVMIRGISGFVAVLLGSGLTWQSVHGVGTFVTDVDLRELVQTFRVRLELAELIGRLDPVAPSAALLAEFRVLQARSKTLRDDPDPRRFAQ